jgi:signal transduction histidine kinase
VLATTVMVTVTIGAVVEYRHAPATAGLPESRLADGWLLLVAVLLVTATGTAGLVRQDEPGVATALAIALTGAVAPFLAAWTALSPPVRAVLPAASYVVAPALARVGTAWTSTRASRLLLACSGLCVVAAAVHVLAYDPFDDPDCVRICREVTPLLHGVVSTQRATQVASALSLAGALLAVAIVVAGSAPYPVRLTATVVEVGIAGAALTNVGLLSDVDRVAATVAPVAVAAVGLSVLITHIRVVATRRALAELLRWLDGVDMGTSQAVLAGASVHFSKDGGWVDARGEPAGEEVTGPAITVPADDGSVTRLVLRPGTTPDLVRSSLTAARMLALTNARIAALSRAELIDVRAAQLRGVQRSDAERRRIERDLHDGAQQSLVSAAIQLGIAAPRLDPNAARAVAAARGELTLRLEHLRSISRGPVPTLLADDGLEAALDELVRTCDVPARLLVHGPIDVGSDPAYAAYLTVKAWLEPPPPAPRPLSVIVELGQDTDWLSVFVTAELAEEADLVELPVEVLDRLGALGGSPVVERENRTRRLMVVIPCAS